MSPIRFLFRFRDLVAPTIREHRSIITERDWCWWGWWKRPSENERADIWDAIATQLTAESSVDVGLFDSGSGKVYRASVIGIIPPSGNSSEFIDSVIAVPESEAEYVPKYYRGSPFSRAWLKLSKIDDKPLKFFGAYSYSEAPSLNNYSTTTLKRFQNKKIHSADELRGMDTTIWRIREAEQADSDEQILLSTKGVSEPVSNEVVNCKYDTILHLTDIHFATDSNREQHIWRYEGEGEETKQSVVDAITSALGNQKIGLLIISGDFTFIGNTSEYNVAKASISHLMGVLDLSGSLIFPETTTYDGPRTQNIRRTPK